jgi:hypothetical protein
MSDDTGRLGGSLKPPIELGQHGIKECYILSVIGKGKKRL